MTLANTILGLQAQTSIHAGTGQNTGVIDLPIQREGHSDWPCIFGSSVKGALRTCAEQKNGKNQSVCLVFGPDTEHASDHGGALAVSDARLLLFPVRSLTSHFKWVTCPEAISRYIRDCNRFDQPITINDDYTITDNESALIAELETTKSTTDTLFLEEYQFTTQRRNLTTLISELSKLMVQNEAAIQQQLVIVSDDMFAHLVQHGTPVNAHIAIDADTKIVKKGALWYQETLPPETLLYIGLSANKARKKDAEMNASDILATVIDLFKEKPWLQIGGCETVGMGWCAVSVLKQGD